MIWHKIKNYRIIRADGSEHFYSGRANDYFAYNFMLALTHLASGCRIGIFRSATDCERVGDYLDERFAGELAAVKSAVGRKKMTFEQLGKVPEMQDFLRKCKDDAEFMRLMKELQIREENTHEPAG